MDTTVPQDHKMQLNNNEMILSEVKAGDDVVIRSFYGGVGMNRRLASLGFTPGARLRMVQNFMHGPLIVFVRGTRVALGRGEAARIIVNRG